MSHRCPAIYSLTPEARLLPSSLLSPNPSSAQSSHGGIVSYVHVSDLLHPPPQKSRTRFSFDMTRFKLHLFSLNAFFFFFIFCECNRVYLVNGNIVHMDDGFCFFLLLTFPFFLFQRGRRIYLSFLLFIR